MKKLVYFIVVGAATLGASAPANAQFAVRMACYSDMQKLCPTEFSARDQDKMRVCLRANLSKASESCQKAVRAQMAADKRD
ncbi:hypothetical protein [Sphingopyxis sp.]|uniref:hypothetical protein n=1 Tax=Sphingopyxis sp. TaxID=1908224 RepID=UPI001D8912C1|nr:hypothetical protein [Sphingopyxis sp.]MBW8294449.1 hypothetical protein [Sphingopyxis sp.]